ncbi:MAG: serine hydrolase domain-containing protein [Alphaproteobacteria bacterium]
MKKVLLKVLLAITLTVAVGVAWKWSDIKRLLAVNALFSEENIVTNFSHMDDIFFHTTMDVPDVPPSKLPIDLREMPDGLGGWIKDRSVTSVVVLKDGNIAYEAYLKGADSDLRISWSVAKSFLSALMGIVLADGDIDSLDDPVTKYATDLIGTPYDDSTIRNVLNMASGVTFNEDYLDFNSDINKMGRVLAMGGSMDKFAANLEGRDRDAGLAWQYVSIDTHIIGMVIRGATGRDIPELMVEKLLTPLGLEADPYMLTDGDGVAFVLGGLNLRTRDYARLGQMFLQGGFYNSQQIVPADWVIESTAPSAPTAEGAIQYGYQWWMPANAGLGEYFARGIYGQYIYIDFASNVVIAVNSADRLFKEPGAFGQNLAMFREIADKLR